MESVSDPRITFGGFTSFVEIVIVLVLKNLRFLKTYPYRRSAYPRNRLGTKRRLGSVFDFATVVLLVVDLTALTQRPAVNSTPFRNYYQQQCPCWSFLAFRDWSRLRVV